MSAVKSYKYELDLGNENGVLRFESDDDLRRFADEQLQYFSWTRGLGAQYTNEVVSHIINTLVNLKGLVENPQYNYYDNVMYHLKGAYKDGGMPIKGSASADFLDDLLRNNGEMVAYGALALMVGKPGHALGSQDAFVGVLLAAMRSAGLGKQSAASARKSFDKLSGSLTHSLAILDDTYKDAESRFSRQSKKISHKAEIHRKWLDRKFLKNLRVWDNGFNDSIEKLTNTQKTFEEFMKLKAPVDYWREKAKQHRQASHNYRKNLISYGRWLAPVVLLILAGIAALSYVTADPSKPIAIQLVFAAIGVLITTVAFWAARIVVRLYMSEHHLAIDAEERATMVMTYLALMERGAAEDKDRALVLAPLFRPTSDGIVKDDAAPEFSPAAIASRFLTR